MKATLTNTKESSSSSDCPHGCIDGFIVDGWTARECSCLIQKRLQARMKAAMIPEEFQDATFEAYRPVNGTQDKMLQFTKQYLADFDSIQHTAQNSFGFMAVFGEQKLREIKDPTIRAQEKRKHNNFGLGKTHLQIAAAKELINRGIAVLCISDVAFMDELSKARAYNDDGETVNRLLHRAINAPVLLWDDIGKAKPSEYRLDMYYQIINERYKAKRPIMYNTNEDSETLTNRVGDAAASRLIGMSRGRVYAVEGADYRLTGGIQ